MFASTNRRDFFKTLVHGAAGLSLPYPAFAQERPAPIASTRLSDNVALITGAGSNVVVVSGADGAAMVNGGLPERCDDLLKTVADPSGANRVRVLFNTDWHLENTGSNETLGKAGARIIAHENTKLWLGAEIIVAWQNRTYKPRPKEALPNSTFYTTGKILFGHEQIEYGHLGQAHTDGDMYVFLPGPNILIAGDVVSVGSYPILDYSTGGWIGGLTDATKTLLGLTDAKTRIVPGSGPLQTREDLQAQFDMLTTMRTRFVEMMRKGMGAKQMLAAAPTKEFDARWGNPELFITNAYPGLWGHVREIGGIV